MPAGFPESASPHLLIVDDDRLVLSALGIGLERSGYRVSTAVSAEEAEALFAGGLRPDLSLLDVRMSGLDGIDLARKMEGYGHLPFMMLSAYGNRELVEQATQHGALGYLVKPLDLPQLLPPIRAALAVARNLRQVQQDRSKMQEVLDANRTINLAVGITMVQHQMDQAQAYELLRQTARSRRCKLMRLAAEVIMASETISLAARK